MTYIHLKSGITETDWIQRSLNEARSDPIGTWQIVKIGREGFGLGGPALEDFVKRFIKELVQGGANPIIGARSAPSGWIETTRYGVKPEDIANALVNDWKNSGIDPDVDGVWFAFPSVWQQ